MLGKLFVRNALGSEFHKLFVINPAWLAVFGFTDD